MRETSQILQKVFAALRADGVTKNAVADALHVHPEDVDELVFGLALTGIEGAATPRLPGDRLRPRLTVVGSGTGS